MIVAAIDIGTNSVLLLIAETGATGLTPLVERATITRLGQGVDRTRELAPDARERTLACLADYASELARHAPARIAAVGTSAMRDARGGPEFAREAEQRLGILPLVIDGEREAELTFRGALSRLSVAGRTAVLDVGGGSTELVVGNRAGSSASASIESATSLDIGSVRLFERHLSSDPPTPRELEAVRRDVESALEALRGVPTEAELVGVAGTVTTLAAVANAIEPYDSARIHGARLGIDAVQELVQRFASLSLAERKNLAGLDPRRADVIIAGAVLVECVLTWSGKSELIVSDRGVRWGLAEELASKH